MTERLSGATVAVLGFGNQGEAQALNLRDSGVAAIVGARASRGAPGRIPQGLVQKLIDTF